MNKQFLKDALGWGFILWLIGYALGMIFFAIVPPAMIGWVITPIGIVITLWVLFKKIKGDTFQYYLKLAFIWTAIAIVLDYLFIVKALKPADGYYKLDVYLYYLLTFALPLFVGWRKKYYSEAGMDLYNKTIEFVDKSFSGKKPHFERTVFWLEKFLLGATEAHKIAAYAHDIERGVSGEKNREYLNLEFLKYHQNEGAEIIGKFLEKNGAGIETINKVKHLVSSHEFGGDDEQNVLMDADSVSFFETNAPHFVEKRFPIDGYEKIKGKLDWMFNRISSEEHKKIARENYEKWSKALEAYKK